VVAGDNAVVVVRYDVTFDNDTAGVGVPPVAPVIP
jgi:hypothetical protein